jgi:AbrB family looped-hinge helix DNA binding protein
MLQAQSKLTSQGQVSVPAAIRQLLNLTPGAVLEWSEEGGRITVSRAVRHSTAEVHTALFGDAAPTDANAKTLVELKQGIRQHMKQRHAGR